MTIDPPSGWTWAQFNTAVDELCPLECKRMIGTMNDDGSSVFYRNHIRQAVLDLQNYIPEFTKNNETVYFPQDFVPDGNASVGALPPLSEFESAWFYSVDRQSRIPVQQVPWNQRFKLTELAQCRRHGTSPIAQTSASLDALCQLNQAGQCWPKEWGNFFMSISPKLDKFYLYPQVEGEWLFSLFWNGLKLDYRDAEIVPLEEGAAAAVAYFVQAQFSKYVDKDLQMAATSGAQYAAKRSSLFVRKKHVI